MKKNVVFPALVLGLAATAAAQTATPTKVGVINIAQVLQSTQEGKRALDMINTRFSPKKAEFDKRQAAIQQLNDQLTKGRTTLTAEKQAQLNNEITESTKRLQRDTQDAQEELDQENNKVTTEMGSKVLDILQTYASGNGYAVIIDVSNQQTSPVLWASTSVDVTQEIIKVYDQKYPVAAATAAAPAANPPASAKPAPAAKK